MDTWRQRGWMDERFCLIDSKWVYVGGNWSCLNRKRISNGMWVIKVKRWDLLRRLKKISGRTDASLQLNPDTIVSKNTKPNNNVKNVTVMSPDLFSVFVGYLNESAWASAWEKDKKKRWTPIIFFFFPYCSFLGYNRKTTIEIHTKTHFVWLSVLFRLLFFFWCSIGLAPLSLLHQNFNSNVHRL